MRGELKEVRFKMYDNCKKKVLQKGNSSCKNSRGEHAGETARRPLWLVVVGKQLPDHKRPIRPLEEFGFSSENRIPLQILSIKII